VSPAGRAGGTRTPQAASGEEGSAQPAQRVLIVEDEILIALDLHRELTAAGFEVVCVAASAEEAVSIAQRERPDAVLMDIRLRGARDGVDAALEIWQRFKICSVFASGNIDDAMKQRAAPAQPLGFVSKPFIASQIVALLRSDRAVPRSAVSAVRLGSGQDLLPDRPGT
jgi:DNA-binding NarL/FixJ family response regulator